MDREVLGITGSCRFGCSVERMNGGGTAQEHGHTPRWAEAVWIGSQTHPKLRRWRGIRDFVSEPSLFREATLAGGALWAFSGAARSKKASR